MKETRNDLELSNYNNTKPYEPPDITKCINCGHVFDEGEIRWASPFLETLCDSCHSRWINNEISIK